MIRKKNQAVRNNVNYVFFYIFSINAKMEIMSSVKDKVNEKLKFTL